VLVFVRLFLLKKAQFATALVGNEAVRVIEVQAGYDVVFAYAN
jgi:hypothetical protein